MLTPTEKVLGNLSVSVKLILGFALVLVLAFFIVIAGWAGLGGLTARSEKLSVIAQINIDSRDVRIARLSYTLKPEAANAVRVLKVLDKLDRRVGTVDAMLKEPESQLWVQQAKTAIKSYRAHFQNLSSATNAHDEVRSIKAQADLNTDIASLFKACAQLSEIEAEKRDQEIKVAAQLLFGASASILIIGILASFIIARLIVTLQTDPLENAKRLATRHLGQNNHVSRRDELVQLQASIEHMTLNQRTSFGALRCGVVQFGVLTTRVIGFLMATTTLLLMIAIGQEVVSGNTLSAGKWAPRMAYSLEDEPFKYWASVASHCVLALVLGAIAVSSFWLARLESKLTASPQKPPQR